jgi:hypothetical protein
MGKGSRREREAVELLKQAGYATYRPATVQFGENDPFGLFDVLAFAPDLPPRFVQVKSNAARGRQSWFSHARLWRAHGIKTEMWVCHDHEGWRVIQAAETGTQTVYDGRESNGSMGDTLVQWLSSSGSQA